MVNKRRLLFPIFAVLGLFICAYAAFFVGVKEELPTPPGSFRNALGATEQGIIATQWPVSQKWRSATVESYILTYKLDESVAYFREAYLTRRLWKEVVPTPGQPKDKAPGPDMTILSFAKDDTQVIIAITPAQPILTINTPLNKALRSSRIGDRDLLAIIVQGQNKV